ncbi:Glyoxalase/Bleomycin resistance protein/Dihydroxybiphenyl dioxygenase [Biscogniauxia mediterranea]|nr:Glyoxalase/Bleomycin resistance protein/Dihydroxybiphenyl dioxygenase [Biscogniauxia mediterranea]
MPGMLIPLASNNTSEVQFACIGHAYFEYLDSEEFANLASKIEDNNLRFCGVAFFATSTFHVIYGQVGRDVEEVLLSANRELQGSFNGPHEKPRKDFSDTNALTFMHLDRGKEYSNHDMMFMQRAPHDVTKSYINHASHEVADLDNQGYENIWGLGRHTLGSQIFDHRMDPSGYKIEPYAAGDLVNDDTPTKREITAPCSIWMSEVPNDYGEDIAK